MSHLFRLALLSPSSHSSHSQFSGHPWCHRHNPCCPIPLSAPSSSAECNLPAGVQFLCPDPPKRNASCVSPAWHPISSASCSAPSVSCSALLVPVFSSASEFGVSRGTSSKATGPSP